MTAEINTEATTPTVKVGDWITALNVPDVGHANNRPARVVAVHFDDPNSRYVDAEFLSYHDGIKQRPEATWAVEGWRKRPTADSRVRIIGNHYGHAGMEGTVETDDFTGVPFYIRIESIDRNYWYEEQAVQLLEPEPEPEWVPAVGDRVRAFDSNIGTDYDGMIGVITDIRERLTHPFRVNFEAGQVYGSGAVAGTGLTIYMKRVEKVEQENVDLVATMQADIDRLAAALREAEQERDTQKHRADRADERFEERNGAFAATVRIIGEALNQNAADRRWCSEYEDQVQEVNDSLPGPYFLPKRKRLVAVNLEMVGETRLTATVYVEVDDEDDAESAASDSDRWLDSEGNSVPNAVTAIKAEYDRMGGFDTVRLLDDDGEDLV